MPEQRREYVEANVCEVRHFWLRWLFGTLFGALGLLVAMAVWAVAAGSDAARSSAELGHTVDGYMRQWDERNSKFDERHVLILRAVEELKGEQRRMSDKLDAALKRGESR